MVKVFCNNCITVLIVLLLLFFEVESKEVKGNLGKAKSINLKGSTNTTTIVHNEVKNQTISDKQQREVNTLEKNVLL